MALGSHLITVRRLEKYINDVIGKKANLPDASKTIIGNISQINSDLTQEVSRATSQDNVLSARIDQIASLPGGSTSGDAELMDIRVGADGVTYASAGDAVRGQVDIIQDEFNRIGINRGVLTKSRTSYDMLAFDFSLNIVKGNKYIIKGESVSGDTNFTTCEIYLLRANGTFTLIDGNYTLGNELNIIPNDNYATIRFRVLYDNSNAHTLTLRLTYIEDSKITKIENAIEDMNNQLDNAIEDINNQLDNTITINDTVSYISGFLKPCVVGDSLSAGLVVSKVSGLSNITDVRFSWAKQLFEKENNTDVTIIARPGATPKTNLEEFSTEISNITNNDLVCVYLGTNQDTDDSGNPYPIGTVADIVDNWDDTPTDTFIGWYSKLLKTISHYNSQYAVGICFGLIKSAYSERTNAIELICNNIDGWMFAPIMPYASMLNQLTDNDDGTHWSPVGYAGYKEVFKKAINKAVLDNPTLVNKTANVFR